MLEDELLEEKEGPLVRDFLADLDKSFPGVFRREPRAIGTLGILHNVLDLKDLLEDR